MTMKNSKSTKQWYIFLQLQLPLEWPYNLFLKITSTFLVSPASDKAGCPSRHHSPKSGQADRADLLHHIDRLDQMHQGYVIGDVSAILLVDEPLVPDDTVHLIAFLCWGNVHGRVHVVLPQTHTPVGGFIQWAGKQVVGWRWKLELVLLFHLAIVQVGSQDKKRKKSCFKELLSSLQKQTFVATWGQWKPPYDKLIHYLSLFCSVFGIYWILRDPLCSKASHCACLTFGAEQVVGLKASTKTNAMRAVRVN